MMRVTGNDVSVKAITVDLRHADDDRRHRVYLRTVVLCLPLNTRTDSVGQQLSFKPTGVSVSIVVMFKCIMNQSDASTMSKALCGTCGGSCHFFVPLFQFNFFTFFFTFSLF